MLRFNDLGIRFGGLQAVKDVDGEIQPQQVTAIIGPNGAGKSTFFNLISGMYKPTSGRVIFQDRDITNMPMHEVARLGIARTFQTTHLFKELPVIENVKLGHRLRTRSGLWDAVFQTGRERREQKESLDRAREALAFVGAERYAMVPAGGVPQEVQKRVSIALALATDPKLVLLDEPAAGINPEETEGLALLIRKMVDRGLTVCLIEHKMSMVMNLADRIMVLHHGQKISEGTPAQVSQDQTVIDAYLGGGHRA